MPTSDHQLYWVILITVFIGFRKKSTYHLTNLVRGNVIKQAQICAEVAKEKILLVFSSNAGINLFIE